MGLTLLGGEVLHFPLTPLRDSGQSSLRGRIALGDVSLSICRRHVTERGFHLGCACCRVRSVKSFFVSSWACVVLSIILEIVIGLNSSQKLIERSRIGRGSGGVVLGVHLLVRSVRIDSLLLRVLAWSGIRLDLAWI